MQNEVETMMEGLCREKDVGRQGLPLWMIVSTQFSVRRAGSATIAGH